MVNPDVGLSFEGYYNNADATAERLRDGWYWSGDLGYMDTDDNVYFAGRNADWLRVDSENFAAAPASGSCTASSPWSWPPSTAYPTPGRATR